MGNAVPKKQYSLSDYLEIESNSAEKYEYHNGEIFAMAGGTLDHSLLSSNILGSIRDNIIKKDKKCNTFNSDAKIAVSDSKFLYADAFVVCGKTETNSVLKEAASNPVLIVEVLSDSTALYDRESKFQAYQSIDSFQEYILVSQEKPSVEIFYKSKDVAFWQFRTYQDMNDVLELKSIDIEIKLSDIYLGWEPKI